MKTVVVELRNKMALRLLKDLERADIIRLIKKEKKEVKGKLSVRLKGSLSAVRAKELTGQLEEIRNEWEERTI